MNPALSTRIPLLSGSGHWTIGTEPPIKVTDGPSGARGDMSRPVRSTSFPTDATLGATWDVELAREIGGALVVEAADKAAHVLLGPTINLQRTPIGGRNFECLSEDPVLTAEIAVAYVDGLQAGGIGACPKHFLGNDQEVDRLTIDIDMDEATLREVYALPFEQVVRRAEPWMLMAAYNRLRGSNCCGNAPLLYGLLKDEWNYEGVVVSDWFAARDTVADALGGLDLEMPGPARVWGTELEAAVADGEVPVDIVGDKLARIDRLHARVAPGAPRDEVGADRPRMRALVRHAAARGTVLLKDEGRKIPFGSPKSVALLGPNSRDYQVMGGGSSFVFTHPVVTLADALRDAFPGAVVEQTDGARMHKRAPLLDGARFEIYNGGTADAPLRATHDLRQSHVELLDTGQSGGTFMRMTATFLAERAGVHTFGLCSAGPARLRADGDTLVDYWNDFRAGDSFMGFGTTEARAEVELAAGEEVELVADYLRPEDAMICGLRIGVQRPDNPNRIARAAALAADADLSVLVLGTSGEWESEGHDRNTLALPGDQDALALAVLAAAPDTVVVLNCGSPVALPWLSRARTVLWTGFGGQEGPCALADILAGRAEPGGRLPFTWPRSLEQWSASTHYPGENGIMHYGEGRGIGYRGLKGEPLFAFGHGLGAADVEILSAARAVGTVQVRVRNPGTRNTSAVVQVYVSLPETASDVPPFQLAGFARVDVSAGQEAEAAVTIRPDYLRQWAGSGWSRHPDAPLRVGLSSSGPFLEIP